MEGASGPEGRHLVLVPDAGEASGPSIRCQGDMSSTNRSNRNGSRVDASATRYATEIFPDVTAPNFINCQSFYRHSIYLNSWHALSNGLRGSVGRASHWRTDALPNAFTINTKRKIDIFDTKIQSSDRRWQKLRSSNQQMLEQFTIWNSIVLFC